MEPRIVHVLAVTPDTWKADKWELVAAFDDEEIALSHGREYKHRNGNYAGYRIRPVLLNPTYAEWQEEVEEE